MLLTLILGCTISAEPKEGTTDDTENEEIDPWETIGPLYGIANLDDDNFNQTADWQEGLIPEEDDLSLFRLPNDVVEGLEDGQNLRIQLHSDQIRIYENGVFKIEGAESSFDVSDPENIEIEFSSYNQQGLLTLSLIEGDEQEKSVQIPLYASPLMVNHHLQAAETIFVISSGGNGDFITGFSDIIGTNLVNFTGYGWDVWIQDEIEFAVMASPDNRVDYIWDSIRDRELDPLAETFINPNFIVETYGSGWATSQDSFGNLEASPPVTVNGKHYPFGRVYYGQWQNGQYNDRMHADMRGILDSQQIQAPVELDVGWLCVGHVDEFISFVPDPTAPQGFRLLVADTNKGFEMLEAIGNVNLPSKYRNLHGFSSSSDMLNSNALRNLNAELQDLYIEPNIDVFKQEFGITEEEIIRFPSLFEEVSQCYGTTAALIPGAINMAVYTNQDGTGADIFMADPFFRSSTQGVESDPVAAYIEELLPDSVNTHWIDDWEWYHAGLGEVHCGSNTIRSPSSEAWKLLHEHAESE